MACLTSLDVLILIGCLAVLWLCRRLGQWAWVNVERDMLRLERERQSPAPAPDSGSTEAGEHV